MSNAPDEQAPPGDEPRISWAPVTPDDIQGALAAGENEKPDDWAGRLSAALAALRGWSVIRSVSVTYGEVDIHCADLHMSGNSYVRECTVLTPNAMTVVADRPEQFTGNEGNGIKAVLRRPEDGAV